MKKTDSATDTAIIAAPIYAALLRGLKDPDAETLGRLRQQALLHARMLWLESKMG